MIASNLSEKTKYLRIEFLLRGIRSHSQNTVFTLQPNLDTLLQVLRNKCRHADAQVDIESVLDFLCCPFSDTTSLSLGRLFLWRERGHLRGATAGQRDEFNLFFRGSVNDTVDVYALEMYCVGRNRANGDNLLSLSFVSEEDVSRSCQLNYFNNSQPCVLSHHCVEILCSVPEGELA